MLKKVYFGSNNTASKVKNIYLGINGKAKKIKKVYLGVNGKAKLTFGKLFENFESSIVPTEWNSTIEPKRYVATNKYGTWTIYGDERDNEQEQYLLYKAFDSNPNSFTILNSTKHSEISNLYLELPEDAVMKPKKIVISYNYIYRGSLYGYNTETNTWDSLGTLPNNFTNYTINISSDVNYSKFRLDMTSESAAYQCRIYNFEITSGTIEY